MQLELERCDDPEVATAAAQAPEEVRVLVLARDDEVAVGRDDVAGAQVVDRETELPHQVADAATEGQAPDAGVADDAAGDREPECLALAVDMVVEATSLDADRPRERVDPRAGHEREVDHQAVIAEGVAGDGVPAAAHRGEQIVLARKPDGGSHVCDTPAPGDQRRPPVDVAVPDPADVVVRSVGRSY